MELVNHFRCDPVVLFSPAEMRAELRRWNVAVPPKSLDEPEPLYLHRLRQVRDAHTTKHSLNSTFLFHLIFYFLYEHKLENTKFLELKSVSLYFL